MRSLSQFEIDARTIGNEHRQAIEASETAAKDLAKADAEFHRLLAVNVAACKIELGATIAEKVAAGASEVVAAKEARDIAASKDRAAMERIRLARDDRAALLTIAAWSRAAESQE